MELSFNLEKAISVCGRTYLWARKCLHRREDGQHRVYKWGTEKTATVKASSTEVTHSPYSSIELKLNRV